MTTRALAILLCVGAVANAVEPERLHGAIVGSVFDTKPVDDNAIDANAPRFGLVGDGVHDDTDGLEAALNASYWDPGRPNCTQPGSRVIFIRGPARYRVTRTIDVRVWQRIIGWGSIRPTLVLSPSTPGFGDSSAPIAMLRANCYAPGSGNPPNATDGNNVAFGVSVVNVNFEIGAGNPGAVALRWRVAQGGTVRAAVFTLAPDAFAAVLYPGCAHQDLVIHGGRFGILIGLTGACACRCWAGSLGGSPRI